MFDLSGKTALVTGATGGLGGAIANAMHAQGAQVVLSGTRAEALEAVKAELGERAFVLPCDLSDAAAVDGLFGAAESLAGEVHIVVSNAGVTRDGLLLRMKDADWEMVLRVNLEAYFRLSRAALKGMMRRRWGRIIGITSIVGVTGNPGQTNYAASKAGIRPRIDCFCVSFSTSVIGLEMNPGATQFTVTLRLATSCARALEKPIIPAFEAA